MTGNSQLVITDLSKSGELVKKADVVAQFDTTDEAFKLRQAEADLAEAEQQLVQAQNEARAKEEELNYELIRRAANSGGRIGVPPNEIRAAMTAKQNDLTLEGRTGETGQAGTRLSAAQSRRYGIDRDPGGRSAEGQGDGGHGE